MKAESQWRVGAIAGVVFLAAMSVAVALARWSENLRREQRLGELSVLAVTHANTVQRNIERALSSTYALAALVRQAGGDIRNFDKIAAGMLPYYDGAAALALAPDGVVTRIVPLAGNEKAIGHNLMADPQRDKEAIRARDTGQLTLAGPFELRQGGVAAAGRLPVFLDAGDGAAPKFWGLVNVLIRFPDVLAPANLPRLVELGYDYELSRIHPDTGRKQVIAASKTPIAAVVEQAVPVPNAVWTLALAPKEDWEASGGLLLKLLLGLLLSLSLGGLAGLLLQIRQHRNWLEQRVHVRTAELELARDAAEAANRAKSAFLANISHELRTPMNGILGMADLALGDELAPQQKQRIGIIRDSGRRLLRIINDLIEYSRLESGTARLENGQFSLARLLESVQREVAPAAAAKGLSWSIECPPELPDRLVGDRQHLQRVLLLYAENAVKFTTQGEVALSVGIVSRSAGSVQLRFAVRDTGIGIDGHERAGLFDGFVQADTSSSRKYGGTGLGLAIVRQLARLLGGTVAVESVKGRGSTFSITVGFALAGPEPGVVVPASVETAPAAPAAGSVPGSVDAGVLQRACSELGVLIEQSDLAAAACFRRHQAMLVAAAPELAARLGEALADFDFDRAAAAMDELAGRLGRDA